MNELKTDSKTLLIGIGNSGRSDDAMGWRFIDEFSSYGNLFDFQYRYQLQIEDAELVSHYEEVIFVDASSESIDDGFSWRQCTPTHLTSFTTHKLSPECILWLTKELYNASPKASVLAIRGTEWELHQGLSKDANENLNKAIDYFRSTLEAEKK